ncbi:MAG: GNAT family N-acetyltransferase [Lachnospiraceae bacterium]|nr:GNAT family N-acetyltransferase [Lachnospiraceae bacterium]
MIKYKQIKTPSPERYGDLAPERIRYMFRSQKAKVIEAADDAGLVGMIAYSYSGKKAELLWLNVLPDKRGQGIGSGLMGEFFEKIAGFEEVIVNLIVTDESAQLQSFLSAYRFRFHKDIAYEFVKELREIKKMPGFRGTNTEQGCESLRNISIDGFSKILAEFDLEKEAEFYDTEELDLSVSCVSRNKKGRITGILLVNRYGGSFIEPVLLRTKDEDGIIAINMLRNSVNFAAAESKADVFVYIKCTDARIGLLIDTIVKDTHPVKMMRGICRSEKGGDLLG